MYTIVLYNRDTDERLDSFSTEAAFEAAVKSLPKGHYRTETSFLYTDDGLIEKEFDIG